MFEIAPVKIIPSPIGPQPGETVELVDGETTPVGGRELARVTVRAEEARDWVVALGSPNRLEFNPITSVQESFSTDIGFAFARIGWGSGGARSEVEIDWRQGGQYNFFGQEVIVTLVKEVAVTAGFGPLRVGAQIAPGKVSGSYATKTVEYGDIAAAATVDLPIPAFARWVYVMRNLVAIGDNYQVQFARLGGATLEQRYLFQNVTVNSVVSPPGRLPVPPQATHLRVFNQAALNSMNDVLALYELAV